MHALVTALGALLVLWGLLAGGWPFDLVDGPSFARATEVPEGPDQGGLGRVTGETVAAQQTSRAPFESSVAASMSETRAEVEIAFRVVYRSDGSAAPEALVELWRCATGEGITYRPARRLVTAREVDLDRKGRGSLVVPTGLALELIARADRRGEPTVVPLGGGAGRSEPLLIVVERPPEPLELLVVDPDGAPVPGANCALGVAGERAAFPGRVLMRTDGTGRATLPGAARKVGHVLVDAPGLGPFAVRSRDLAGLEGDLRIELVEAGELSVRIPGAAQGAAKGLRVEVDFDLEGFRARRTAFVDRRGRAVVRSLPPDVTLVLRAVTAEERVGVATAVTLDRGESREVTVEAPAR